MQPRGYNWVRTCSASFFHSGSSSWRRASCRALGGWKPTTGPPYLSLPPPIPPRAHAPGRASAQVAAARIPVELTLRRGETAIQVFGAAGPPEPRHARRATLSPSTSTPGAQSREPLLGLLHPDSSLASLQITLEGTGRFPHAAPGASWRLVGDLRAQVEMRVLSATLDGSFEGAIRTRRRPLDAGLPHGGRAALGFGLHP